MNKAIENQENKCILSNKNTSNSGQKEENRKQISKIFSNFNENSCENNINRINNSLKSKNDSNDYPKDNVITTENKIEKDEFGNEINTQTRYDKNHNIISKKIFYKNNNNNNRNIYHNNNQNNNNITNKNDEKVIDIFKTSNGYTIETKVKTLPNNKKKVIKTMKDENNVIIDVEENEISSNNRINNIHNQNNNISEHIDNIPPYFIKNKIKSNPININRNISNRGRILNNNRGTNIPINNFNNRNNLNMNINNLRGRNRNNLHNNYELMRNNLNYMNMIIMHNNLLLMNMQMQNRMNNSNRLHPNILNSLLESEVKDASKLDPNNKDCIICMEEFKNNEKIICLPCIHSFHSECIKSWFEGHNECPICKYKLTNENLHSHP